MLDLAMLASASAGVRNSPCDSRPRESATNLRVLRWGMGVECWHYGEDLVAII